ncbi:efflux RND transporter periplasmic adaptor subunit [Glaciecola sp. SC05]|uniref:efflux RND transporter periplasmic adaptor subunit n=1 Tax=Glaciecola sp. SC05 TaxID=1987355 RepID=UPI0035270B57
MRTLLIVLICFSTWYAIASPGAHGPNGEHLTNTENASTNDLGRQADGSVIMPMSTQALLGIRTQFVTSQDVKQSITLAGVVRAHPEGQALIQSSSDGRFEAGDTGVLATGEKVVAGQLLGYVRYQDTAFELANQTSQLLAVRSEIMQVKRDVKRLRDLAELASKQSLERLETDLKILVEQEAALQQGLEKPEPLIAPITGILVNHRARRGRWVEAGTTLFEVIASNMRYIEALTNDTSLVGQLTTASIDKIPELNLQYRGYSPQLNAGMATLHFELDTNNNATSMLLIDQPLTVFAELENSLNGIVLPAEAVVTNTANLPIVWIKVSAERFLPQIVQYRQISANQVLITQGLGADNRVVSKGTSLLNQIR